ncbi:hypothetical protein [Halomonas koreensis]|uniref:Uncharacterized protein n=1 Tax=Halomonas koreensis TaxID=245385 RepID=A0ABU1G4S3_9GAMM|nr:hypothetical protein [Halomonas koreensis]MDR5867959.1 hypothetical protein [Halomonas koreensis]
MATCTGSGSFQTCYDAQSGNSYSVQRHGNTTTIQGYNSNTGSTWNQTSRKIGGTTFHNGMSSDGNSWSGTSRSIGSQTYHQGIDSDGEPYSGYSYD